MSDITPTENPSDWIERVLVSNERRQSVTQTEDELASSRRFLQFGLSPHKRNRSHLLENQD